LSYRPGEALKPMPSGGVVPDDQLELQCKDERDDSYKTIISYIVK
jgi:hypothetical protein